MRRMAIKWFLLIFLGIVPLLWIPDKIAKVKFASMLENENLEESVTFQYTDNRCVTCCPENSWDQNAMCYVYLPPYADLDAIYVSTQMFPVGFIKDNEMIYMANKRGSICSFEENVPYTMCFFNPDNEIASLRNVIFLKSGKLPTLYVNTEAGDMTQLNQDKDYKEKGYMELVDVKGNTLLFEKLKSISARGNHTFSFEKKSYQIKLEEGAELLGMGSSDTWILLSNVYDNSYMRNKLTYDMALQADMPGSPHSEYIDVYFNGVYNGMYLLCEKVEFGENRLEFADLESQNRFLNGGGNCLDTVARFQTDNPCGKGVELETNPEDITGGYLIEHDYGDKYEEELSGFVTKQGEEYVLKNPEHASREQVAYIAGLMQEIEDAISSEDGYNPDTGKHFTEYIDLESWADKYLIEEITRNNGGGLSSSYFYKPCDSVSTKVFGGPVWDYDKAYGRSIGHSRNIRDLTFLSLHWSKATHWFYDLYQQEEFVEAVKKEYREKFSGYLQIMADEMIDEYCNQIDESAVLDTARFAQIYYGYDDDIDYRVNAENIRNFILERKEFLDKIWIEEAPLCQIRFQDEKGDDIRYLAVMKGECIEELPAEIDEDFLGWKIEGREEFLTSKTVIMEDMNVVLVRKFAG